MRVEAAWFCLLIATFCTFAIFASYDLRGHGGLYFYFYFLGGGGGGGGVYVTAFMTEKER